MAVRGTVIECAFGGAIVGAQLAAPFGFAKYATPLEVAQFTAALALAIGCAELFDAFGVSNLTRTLALSYFYSIVVAALACSEFSKPLTLALALTFAVTLLPTY